jgi:hypothetical protein
MFALGQEESSIPVGVSVEEAGDIAGKNTVMVAIGSIVVFFLIYKFLIK